MNKSDLNSSMLFKIRNFGLCVLLERNIDDNLAFYDKDSIKNGNPGGGVSSLKIDYDDNLIFNFSSDNEDFNIIAIKQYKSCTQVINMVLNDKEPEEWDWVEEVKEDKQLEESNIPIVNNITINITVDSSNNDSEQILKQINDAIKRNGICCQQ